MTGDDKLQMTYKLHITVLYYEFTHFIKYKTKKYIFTKSVKQIKN